MSKAPPSVEQVTRALEKLEREKPIPPKQVGIGLLSDATPQAIPKFIKQRNLYSFGIITPEGEEILTNGIKHKSSILNKGYSGEATQRFRVGEGDQSYNVPITTCMFVQPDVAEKAFGAPGAKMRGTGMLARALLAFPETTQGTRFIPPPEDFEPKRIGSSHYSFQASRPKRLPNATNIEQRYQQWVTDTLQQADHHRDKPRTQLKLTQEAQALWHQAFNECELALQPGGRYADFRDHASKLPDQWLRVAGIIHCYDNGLDGEISSDTLLHAIQLVNAHSSYFTALFAPMTEEYKNYVTLQQYLNRKRRECRYIPKRIVTTNGPLRPVKRVDVILDTMFQRGEINWVPYFNYTQQGRQTKTTMVIDLYPVQPPDPEALQQAAQQAYRLGQL